MPDAKVNGTEIYYETHGEGPVIVFAHGVGGNHSVFFQQVAYFARSRQVITFDHRGFGRSKEIPEGPDRAEFVEDLHGLLDHLNIEHAALVAQSMGGIACLGLAARYPERVSALVMADTVGSMDDEGLQALTTSDREFSDGLAQLDRAVSKGFQVREPAMSLLFLQLNSFNRTNRRLLRDSGYVGPTPDAVQKSGVPVMFLVGQEDVVASPTTVRGAHKLLPGSVLAEVPDAAHSVYWEKPDVFNYLVEGFLTKHES
jgi:pimeloyl-ACP methyl ester carboxylesterase